tara:strand:+ start:61 stop:444 length:384 start_codon:yes stop_codon:yes gene_type:complete
MLGDRLDIALERVHLIRDYPNSLFFKAFDFSVQAGGYNSFHEMRSSSIPTLFLPNMQTGMDDQLARCMVAKDEGWGLVAMPDDPLEDRIAELLDHTGADGDSVISVLNGAEELADRITSTYSESIHP